MQLGNIMAQCRLVATSTADNRFQRSSPDPGRPAQQGVWERCCKKTEVLQSSGCIRYPTSDFSELFVLYRAVILTALCPVCFT